MFQRTTKLLRGLTGFADDKWVSALSIEGIRSSAYRQVLARFGFGFGADLGQMLTPTRMAQRVGWHRDR
jgi:hypothetical protein